MIDFWKITPGGNPTILLRAEDVPPPQRVAVSNQVMSPQSLGAEQVGFISMPGGKQEKKPGNAGLPRLDMMGGEFCLNATRAFALLLAQEGRLPEATPAQGALRAWAGLLESSGASAPVRVEVQQFVEAGDELYRAMACLELEDFPQPQAVADKLELVSLPGISHFIASGQPPAESELPALCARLRKEHGLEQEDAIGMMWLEEACGKEAHRLFPVVWVRATNSLCLESACGSGTLACALALHSRNGSDTFSFRQPSGHILDLRFSADRHWAEVSGPAYLVAQGRLNIR